MSLKEQKEENNKTITEFERELEVKNYNEFNPDFDFDRNEDEVN